MIKYINNVYKELYNILRNNNNYVQTKKEMYICNIEM